MNRWMRQRAGRAGAVLALLSPLAISPVVQAADNVEFTGTLVNAPCTLHPGDDEQELSFNSVVDSYLYRYGQTRSRPFSLRLDDCDTSVMTGVKLTFKGKESLELPGHLAFDDSSVAQGVVVGLQTAAGQALPIQGAGITLGLTPGNMEIALQAYLKAEPVAQNNQGIVRGPFTATATFALDYQ